MREKEVTSRLQHFDEHLIWILVRMELHSQLVVGLLDHCLQAHSGCSAHALVMQRLTGCKSVELVT